MSVAPTHASTAAGLYFQQRRLEFDHAAANRALAVIRKGQTLHMQYRAGRPHWSLSDGTPVTAEVAAILIRDAHVEPADGALFETMPGQSWRYVR
jgi:hypothetical protein